MPSFPCRVQTAIRVLARALFYFILVVFAAPHAWRAISGREVSTEIHSWVSWLVMSIGFVLASALEELVWHLLTQTRRARSNR